MVTLWCQNIMAQLPSSFLSFGLGSTNAVGQYAASSNLATDGFAKGGTVASFDFTKYYGGLGYSGTISFGGHSLNHDAINNAMPANAAKLKYTDSSRWMSSCVMFGPSYGWQFGKFGVDVRMMGGLYFAKAPDTNMPDESAVDKKCWKFNNNWYDCVAALGYQCGAGIRYNVCHRWMVYGRTSYFHAHPNYSIKSKYTNESGKPQEEYKFSQRTSAVDVVVGVAYKFRP